MRERERDGRCVGEIVLNVDLLTLERERERKRKSVCANVTFVSFYLSLEPMVAAVNMYLALA